MERKTTSFVDLDPKERHEVIQRQLAARIRFYEQKDRERAARRERRQRLLGWLRLRPKS